MCVEYMCMMMDGWRWSGSEEKILVMFILWSSERLIFEGGIVIIISIKNANERLKRVKCNNG